MKVITLKGNNLSELSKQLEEQLGDAKKIHAFSQSQSAAVRVSIHDNPEMEYSMTVIYEPK